MGIDRLYYYAAAFFLCSLLCNSHIKINWPEQGFHPHSGMGNVFAKKDKPEPEAPRKPSRHGERKRERSRARDPRRDRYGDGPWRSAMRDSERSSRRPHPSHAHFAADARDDDYRGYIAATYGLDEPSRPIQRWR